MFNNLSQIFRLGNTYQWLQITSVVNIKFSDMTPCDVTDG